MKTEFKVERVNGGVNVMPIEKTEFEKYFDYVDNTEGNLRKFNEYELSRERKKENI